MGSFIEGLKHAFALGPAPNESDGLPASLEKLARAVVSRKLEMIALLVLETATPLNFLASQTAAALLPLLSGLMDVKDLEEAAVALEDRSVLRRLIARIEALSLESEVSC